MGDESYNEKNYIEKITIDPFLSQVRLCDRRVKFTHKEYSLFYFLISNPNKVITRSEIFDQVWGDDFKGSPRVIDTYIKLIRMKIDNDRCMIKTVSKIGYKFEQCRWMEIEIIKVIAEISTDN